MPVKDRTSVIKGGEMHPAAVEQAARSRQFAEQRQQLAMQEAGEAGRARLASATQLSAERTRAAAQLGVAHIQSAGASARTAMQVGAEDRRAAEGVRALKDNQEFMLERDRQQNTAREDLARLEDELETANRGEEWERADDLMDKLMDAGWSERALDRMYYDADIVASLSQIDKVSQTELTREKAKIATEEMVERFDTQQGVNEALRRDIRTSLESNIKFGFEEGLYDLLGMQYQPGPEQRKKIADRVAGAALAEEIKKLNMPGLTVQMLSYKGSSWFALEDLVTIDPANGGLGFGELTELYILLDECTDYMKGKIAHSSDEEEPFYRHFLGRINEATSVLNRLRSSKNKEVKRMATDAWGSFRREGPSSRLKKGVDRRGVDIVGILEDRIASLQSFDRGLFRGEYAGDFVEELEAELARLKTAKERFKRRKPGGVGSAIPQTRREYHINK